MSTGKPLVTFYTPTYKRPVMLSICRQSVEAQSDPSWEQLIVPDEVGIGIPGMFREIPNNTRRMKGRYIYVLQDDDMLADKYFVEELRKFLEAMNDPEVVIVRTRKGGLILPLEWKTRPRLAHIDLANYVVRADVFLRHAEAFGQRYEGDFDFINRLWELQYRFEWLDRLVCVSQAVGRGRTEDEIRIKEWTWTGQ